MLQREKSSLTIKKINKSNQFCAWRGERKKIEISFHVHKKLNPNINNRVKIEGEK